MAKLEALSVKVSLVKFMLVIFPIATYSKIGDVDRLTVFGLPVYKKTGNVKSLFGFVWGSNAS